jgi:hypothetical protein
MAFSSWVIVTNIKGGRGLDWVTAVTVKNNRALLWSAREHENKINSAAPERLWPSSSLTLPSVRKAGGCLPVGSFTGSIPASWIHWDQYTMHAPLLLDFNFFRADLADQDCSEGGDKDAPSWL